MDPSEFLLEPPRVRVRADKVQAMELLRFLDRRKKLRLIEEGKVCKSFLCGAV